MATTTYGRDLTGMIQFNPPITNATEIAIPFLLFPFMAEPAAYGSSWARGRIKAVAEAYATAMATLDLSRICDPCHSLQQLEATLDP